MKRIIWLLAVPIFCGAVQAQTLSEIRTAVRRNVRDTSSTASLQRYSDTILTTFVNEAQRDVVMNTWIISKSTTITLVANTTYYSLPTDVINIQRVTVDFANLPEVLLEQQDADNGNTAWETSGTTPASFFQDKSQTDKVGITPYPTSAGTMRIIYFAFATDLSSDSDVPFNSLDRFKGYHDLLTWYATYRILFIEGMFDKATNFKGLYDTRLPVLYQDYGAKPARVPQVVTKENKP